jgi:hypothetical protein
VTASNNKKTRCSDEEREIQKVVVSDDYVMETIATRKIDVAVMIVQGIADESYVLAV